MQRKNEHIISKVRFRRRRKKENETDQEDSIDRQTENNLVFLLVKDDTNKNRERRNK
jgi:hypothetical protein